MKKCRAIGLVLALSFIALSSHSQAQEEAPQPSEDQETVSEPPWSNKAELALVQTSGNSESFTFSLRDNFVWSWERASLTSEVFALRSEATNRLLINEDGEIVEESVTELTGEQYTLFSKYNRVIDDRMGWYGDVNWERNKLAGLDSRFRGGGGVSYKFIDTEPRRLLGEAGLGYAGEKPVSGEALEFPVARLFGRYEHEISETSGFETQLELLGNLEEIDDFTANFLAAVTARMTAKTALRVSYMLAYDNRPIVIIVEGDDPDEPEGTFEFDPTDGILSASLVIDF